MMRTRTLPWKTEDHLETPGDIAAYLEAVFEDGDPELISHALGAVARSKGMTAIARRTGLGRQSLYKALSPEGRPEFNTVLKVVRALGLTLTVAPSVRKPAPRAKLRNIVGAQNRGVRNPSPKGVKRLAK
jgi:probable addiction module antidote protein